MPEKILFWLGMMLVFFIIFLLSFVSMGQGTGILGIMPYRYEDPVVMGFSVLGIVKSIYENHRR
jgi:hypothetical protein